MKKLKLLISDDIDEKPLLPLERYYIIEKRIGIPQEELGKIISGFSCLITRTSTSVPRQLIEKSTQLKIIGRASIGVDNIDIFAATERGIAVINAPLGNAYATAEHTMGLIFSLLRNIPFASSDLKRGIWGKKKYIGTQIKGKTLGIIGFGNVGKEVYKLGRAVGMQVRVCEPYMAVPSEIYKVTFEELLRTCDIITLHVPLTYLTRFMINRKTLSLCKEGAYIINCSRGGVAEEKAILLALENNQLGGFAVDVFSKEPPIDNKLLMHPKVVATPHIAGSTFESQRESVNEVVSGICQYIEGSLPSNLLNPQVFKKQVGKKAKERLPFETIVFDCDSTLTTIEGINELAELAGLKKKISALTNGAMDGLIPFEEVYEKRLKLLKPTKQQLDKIGTLYIENIAEDARDVIEALTMLGKSIYIVSGGFTAAILHLGNVLGIPRNNIYGTDLLHDKDGNYISYIEGPLRRNKGKLQIIRQLSGRKLMVGDSVTDLETRECVDLFVGYGGVVKRPIVENKSDIYLRTKSLSPLLLIILNISECKKLMTTKYRRLIGKGVDLLSHQLHVKVEKSHRYYFEEIKKLAYY